MKTLILAGKPIKPLDNKTKNLLTVAQRSVKYRFKQYKKGKQQGLEMVWRNIMQDLKENFEKSLQKTA
ncbi:hypothetical protein MT068_001536 [Salmonella enterica]|nr:hypothetical protein [Salmonella enterica]